jgi:hypothetical protein
MARRVFFSFHYKDVTQVNIVRHCNTITRKHSGEIEFYDSSLWEETKKNGPLAIKRLINGGLRNTSVTCALVGQETWERPWVRYELLQSFARGNGILGIRIHNVGFAPGAAKSAGIASTPAAPPTPSGIPLSSLFTDPAELRGIAALSGIFGMNPPPPPPPPPQTGLGIFGAAPEYNLLGSSPPRAGLGMINTTPEYNLLGIPPPTRAPGLINSGGIADVLSNRSSYDLANALLGLRQPPSNALAPATPPAPPPPKPGLNVLEYLGFTVDERWRVVRLHEKGKDGTWSESTEVDPVPFSDLAYNLRGMNAGNFSQLFPTYTWVTDKGSDNFTTWVNSAAIQAGR